MTNLGHQSLPTQVRQDFKLWDLGMELVPWRFSKGYGRSKVTCPMPTSIDFPQMVVKSKGNPAIFFGKSSL